eukprot:169055_1
MGNNTCCGCNEHEKTPNKIWIKEKVNIKKKIKHSNLAHQTSPIADTKAHAQIHIENKTSKVDLPVIKTEFIECKSVKDCICIKNLSVTLKYYSILDIVNDTHDRDVFSNFINEVYHRLLDDYIHLVNKHGHDLNEIDLSSIECNDMKSCQFTSRHQKQKADDNKLEPELNFYKQVMDSFHFFVSHLYHCGLRTISNNDDDDDEIENEDEYFDKVFYRLNKQIKQ